MQLLMLDPFSCLWLTSLSDVAEHFRISESEVAARINSEGQALGPSGSIAILAPDEFEPGWEKLIITTEHRPPIPGRDHDFSACWRDELDRREARTEFGWGKSPAHAIIDLIRNYSPER